MSKKDIVIELEEDRYDSSKYRITRLVNTVDYKIRQSLSKKAVEGLCNTEGTKIVIKPNRNQKQ